ncbi:caspase-8-like [Ptychodera flava]|uniref:caspase-8-like n=1 Tax=Ptychodera flava TaxID=63121 RepID=UPI003969C032
MAPDRKNATNPGKPQRVQPYRNSKGQRSTQQRQTEEDDLRSMLYDIGKELNESELESLKFLLGKYLPGRKRAEIKTPEDLFEHLIQGRLISPTDLSLLRGPLERMYRRDLTEIVDRFLANQKVM